MEKLDGLDRAWDHTRSLLSELKAALRCKSEHRNEACFVTKGILVSSKMSQSCNFLDMRVINEVRSSVAATEDKTLASCVDNMSIAFSHHERADEAALSLGCGKMSSWGSFRCCFNHLLFDSKNYI